ncbi:hypothetical protein GCM10022291_15850 [Postechiella marina]|uniref:Uncharacterized protein n=1 Tax=Postechiella marina TaxID=943941 RepID=A0ABP8C7C9_9FLAO
MKPFRSEIRNSPSQQTIKIFLNDQSLDNKIKNHLEQLEEVDFIELRESVGRNREDENITIFFKDHVDIHKAKEKIDSRLWWYFEEDMVD